MLLSLKFPTFSIAFNQDYTYQISLIELVISKDFFSFQLLTTEELQDGTWSGRQWSLLGFFVYNRTLYYELFFGKRRSVSFKRKVSPDSNELPF